MRGTALRWWIMALAAATTPACDNVHWGGVDMHLQAPPARDSLLSVEHVAEAEEAPVVPSLPEGAILFSGSRDGATGSLIAVGEVRGDIVAPLPTDDDVPGFRRHFIEERLSPGTELILFSEGVRVGRLTVAEGAPDEAYCGAPPRVSGVVELVPAAAAARNFLALDVTHAGDAAYARYRPLRHTYDQRVASLRLATKAIPRVGATWPPSLLETRREIRAFQLIDASAPSIAATFIVGDQLRVGPAPPRSYAMFLMAHREADRYLTDFVWYRPADREGKGEPRYVDQLDWDGDGRAEVLLEVLGSESRWFAGLARRGNRWVRAFENSCGTPSGPVASLPGA